MKKLITIITTSLLLACGGEVPTSPIPTMGTPDGGDTVTYTKIPNPNDTLSLNSVVYSRNGLMKVTFISGQPVISLGPVPGQSWFVFPGSCPTIQDSAIVFPLYQKAVLNKTIMPLTVQPTAFAVGLYVGVQLPESTCFEFVNCDSTGMICSFEPYSLEFK